MAGRAAPTFIVEQEEILSVAEIRKENIILRNLIFPQIINTIKWLAKRRLIHNVLSCNKCNIQMTFIKYAGCIDGYRWKCKSCNATASVRKNTFFSQSKLKLEQVLIIIYGWTKDWVQRDIACEAELGNNSTHTIVNWCQFCRDVCEQYLIDNPIEVGGLDENGLSKIVEVDESQFFHQKYNKGQWQPGHWVFGGVEHGSGKCFLVEVPNRDVKMLSLIIERYILPGTIIISDGWRGYNNIAQIGGGIYEHQIIHEENFIDPNNDEVHIQHIENVWLQARHKLKLRYGATQYLFASYLHEFMYRNCFKNTNIFSVFLTHIAEQNKPNLNQY